VSLTRAATALAAGLAAVAPHTVNPAISGAALSVVEKTGVDLRITIENLRDSPLVDYMINPAWAGFSPWVRLQPHQRGTISVHVEDPRAAARAETLDYVFFEDGYYEGHGRSFDQWLAQRAERVEDLRYWVNAFNEMPRVSIAEMRRYLSDQIAERESRRTVPQLAPHVSDRVSALLRQFPAGPFIVRPMDLLRQEVETDLIAATRVPADRTPFGHVDVVTAATVTSTEAVPSKVYSLTLENLRDAGIEAFGYYKFERSGRPQGGAGEDYYLSDPAKPTPGRGRVQPHEVRDLYQQFESPTPIVRLSYVMFDDYVFEGDASEREQLLTRRENEAAEFPAALAALAETIKKPPAEIESFLVERLATRIKQTQVEGRFHSPVSPLDLMVAAVRRSPDQFLKDADATRVKYEQQYQRLTREIAALQR
jgi:hypothetical protein